MTRTLFFAIHLALFTMGATCIGTYSALAEDLATSSEVRETETIKMEGRGGATSQSEEYVDRRTDIGSTSESFADRVEEQRKAFARKLQERLYNLTQNIVGRMSAAVFRLEHIAGRIDSRAQKLKEERGIDDSRVETELTRARTALYTARTTLDNDLGKFAYTENPRAAFGEIRTAFKDTNTQLREAHSALVAAFAALKEAPNAPTATTTVTEESEQEDVADVPAE